MKKVILLFYFLIFICDLIHAQTTPIPDANFEQQLITLGIDTNGANGNILNADAQAVTNLTISVNTITDFTGLEAFVNVITLNLGRNQFATVPLATLTQLEELTFADNDALSALDLSSNTALRILDIGSRFSGGAPHPPITSLNLSNNINLEDVDLFYYINMTSLTFPATSSLTRVELYNLAVETIDLSMLAGLEDFRVRFSSAATTNITLPDVKTALKKIDIQGLRFNTVDIEDYIALEFVEIHGSNMQTILLPPTNTLQVLDIRDHNLGFLSLAIVPQLTRLRLTDVISSGTPLTVDVSQNIPLEILELSRNKMSVLDVTRNINLRDLDISANEFTSIDLSQNTALEEIQASSNRFPTIDVTQNTALIRLTASYNLITDIDLTQNTALEYLYLDRNQLPNLDITRNIALKILFISYNLFTTTGLDLTQNVDLLYLDASHNQIESLNIMQNPRLGGLVVSHNLFPGINIMQQYYDLAVARGRLGASQRLDVSFNLLSGRIPDFAGITDTNYTNYFEFIFNDNYFEFGDFENEHNFYVRMLTELTTNPSFSLPIFRKYSYAPQAKVNNIENFTRNAGESITLTTVVRGSQNHYRWFKDDVEITGASDSPEFTIYNLTDCDKGVYHCEITSDLVPFENSNPPGTNGKNLLLVRNDINLTVTVSKTCVSLTNPLNNATNVPINTGLEWEANPGACGYRLTVGTTSGGTDLVNNEDVGTATAYNFLSDLPLNQDIYVNITPYFSDGDLGGCTEETFSTGTGRVAPECTSLTIPLNNSNDVATNTDLTWNPGNGADGYRITVGTTSGGNDLVNDEDVGNVTTYSFASNLPAGSIIYVTIVPYNTEGDAAGCVEELFTTRSNSTLPNCTSLINPANGASDVSVSADLSWNAVAGATGYRLSIGTASGGTDLLNDQDVGNVTTYNPATDFPEATTIYVTIIPYNSAGDAISCGEESFTTETVVTIPNCTILINPANGASDVLVSTDLSWNAVAGATGYRLSIGTASGGTDLLNDQDVGNVTTYNPATDFPEATTIYVTIIPYNSAGDAISCGEESFTTETVVTIPNCTILINPANGASDVLVSTDLSWNAVAGATGYRLSIGTASGGTDLLNDQDVGNVTTYNPATDFPEATTIYVTIIPYNSAGDAISCGEESFTTETVVTIPNCTSLINPANGASDVSVSADLSWNAVAGATGYRLSIGTASGGIDLLNDQDVGNVTTYNPATDFPEATTIYVTIIPYNSAGDAISCGEESFTTETVVTIPNCSSLINPANGASDVSVSADLSWNAVVGATGYRLSIGTASGGTDLLNDQDVGNVTTYNPATDFPEATTIYVTIIPYNSAGDAISCGEESFTTETVVTIPNCTSLINPANGASDVSVSADLSWNAVTGATGYRLSIGTASGGTDLLNDQDVGNVTTYNPATDFPEATTIYVTIIPYNSAGDAISCGEESFTTETVVTIPNCTSLINPVNGAINVAANINLNWNAASDATGYFLSIGTSPLATDLLDNFDAGNVTTYNPATDFPEGATIYITIVPYNTAGSATGCTEESFTIETLITPPGCTNLLNPINGSVDIVVDTDISWRMVENSEGYLISIGDAPGLSNLVNNEDVGNSTNYTLANDLPEGTQIYVSVTPYNSAGNAIACTEESFTTEQTASEIKYGFSPDGDGINDFWEIPGIENYPQNTVTIYNRWGDMVFQINGYDNNSRVFRGDANNLTGRGAGLLPEGTYFFQLQISGDHNFKETKGFVVIKR
ncbi:gliding motility-associated C-terminal domain-containing protein [Flavobacteriaceae bacterium M23B6Z8]